MLVADVMTREPVTVARDRSVKDALALLARYAVTALPVVERDGRVVGVVSEADLIREQVPADPRAHLLPSSPTPPPARLVAEVYTPHAITVRRHDDLAAAVELMTSTGVKSLPVVDEEGVVVGIVARSDVVRMLARADEAIAAELDDTFRSLGRRDWLVTVADGVVEVAGPASAADRSLAEVVARTIGGVVEVHV
jgi:CBS domain-containing protein